MSIANISILSITLAIVGAVSVHRFVTTAGTLAGNGDNTIGVAAQAGEDEHIMVDAQGLITVEAGGVVTAGSAVQSDAEGRAIDRTTGAVVARAIDSAAVPGEYVRCMLIPN